MRIKTLENNDGTVTLKLFDGRVLCKIAKNLSKRRAGIILKKWEKYRSVYYS